MAKLKLGIALGSGAARGWAHIGVLRELAEHGIYPDYVAGASMGSLVGAAYASEQLDTLEDWVRQLGRLDVIRLLDASFRGGGVIAGSRVMDAVGDQLRDFPIEKMERSFAAVATELESGREVWLREGSMLSAVRASCGLPGLFAPTKYQGRWLIDGGVVNPVPVSLCNAMGADVVIAVNLNAFLVSRKRQQKHEKLLDKHTAEEDQSTIDRLSNMVGSVFSGMLGKNSEQPGILDVVSASINIMQERITRSRMAGEPPRIEIRPRLPDIELMDFHRADTIIDCGAQAVRKVAKELEELTELLEHRQS
ncbi:MAG: patatin-like phospholipase RssA [Gammaproteobacteria bacterium]|nr:patatin-like phospholipase RssA [Gammaproteobacteria bacterium]